MIEASKVIRLRDYRCSLGKFWSLSPDVESVLNPNNISQLLAIKQVLLSITIAA